MPCHKWAIVSMILPFVVQSNCPTWVFRGGEQQLQILKLHISIISCYFSPFTFSDAYHEVIASQLDKAACSGVAALSCPSFERGIEVHDLWNCYPKLLFFFIGAAHPWHMWQPWVKFEDLVPKHKSFEVFKSIYAFVPWTNHYLWGFALKRLSLNW